MAIANSGAVPFDDDLDGNLDIDPDDITEVEMARQKIKQLMHEQERAADYEDRLTRKLQRLDADLASKREQVEGLQRSLNLERNKFAEEYRSEKRERETKAKTQEERIREYLTEVLYTKPKQKEKRGEFHLDTVLVSFVKPNESFRYNLAFRVDSGTTVAQLRNSACKYWGVSSEYFILRTMANNKCQDDNKVKDCFKQGEIAQLRLEMKRESAEPPSEEELKAIQPKSKKRAGNRSKGKPRYNAEGVEQIQKFGENYANQLKKMGGVFFLLKLRDSKPSEHAGKINLRNILIYTALVILSGYVYVVRRPVGEAYWCAKGIQDYLLVSTPRLGGATGSSTGAMGLDRQHCVPGFEDVQTFDDIWDWLNYTVPEIFWVDEPTSPILHTYNQLLGYFSIRVQNVKEPTTPTEFCANNAKLVADFNALADDGNNLSISCFPRALSDANRRTDAYPEISSYWRNQTMQSQGDSLAVVRGLSDPGLFRSKELNRERHGISNIEGLIDTYDASGYSVDYRMTVSDPDEHIRIQYRSDLQVFRDAGWIGTTTRVVIMSFSTYNHDYDVWTASDFLFEIPPDGDLMPSFSVKPFKPRIYETRDELTFTYIDYVRLAIAIYILIFVGWAERQHKVRNHKAGFYYHISLSGITDLGLVICIFVTVVWRTVVFHDPPTASYIELADDQDRVNGFRSFRQLAWEYNTVFILDGIVMVFLMYRMITFFRLSHTIYLQWKAIGQALKAFIFFTLIFVPAIAGFIVVSTALFGKYILGFSSLMRTSVSTFKLTHGDLHPNILDRDVVVGVISAMALYLLLTFFLMNVFITIFVDAYYVIRLTCTQPAEKWDGQRIRSWALPGVCVSMFQAVWPSQVEGRD